MPFYSNQTIACRVLFSCYQTLLVALLLVGFSPAAPIHAQGSGGRDSTGSGGSHTIKGRIYFPSGRPPGTTIKVSLDSPNSTSLSALADRDGAFSFSNLEAGNFTLIVEAGDAYEVARESVTIDKEMSESPRVRMVPIYLQSKRAGSSAAKPGVLNAALASVPKPAAELYQKGLEAAQAGNPSGAIDFLKKAISLYAYFALALNELGVQYLKLGQAGSAAEALAAAVKTTPDAFTPRLNYGIALLNKKDFAGAETQLREAVKRNTAAPTAHMYLGITLINLRQYDEAERELRHAVTSGGNELSQAHYYLGGLYWRRREYKRAADELETYLRLTPKASNAEQVRTTVEELRSKQ